MELSDELPVTRARHSSSRSTEGSISGGVQEVVGTTDDGFAPTASVGYNAPYDAQSMTTPTNARISSIDGVVDGAFFPSPPAARSGAPPTSSSSSTYDPHAESPAVASRRPQHTSTLAPVPDGSGAPRVIDSSLKLARLQMSRRRSSTVPVLALTEFVPAHVTAAAALPQQPEEAERELRDLLAQQEMIERRVRAFLAARHAAAPSHAQSRTNDAAISDDDATANQKPQADGSEHAPGVAPPAFATSIAPTSAAVVPASAVDVLDAGADVTNLLLTQQRLLSSSITTLQQTLSSFHLLRDVYQSAAYAERRVRAQLTLDQSLQHTRKRGLEAMNDAILTVLASSIGASRVALYFAGKTHLFGLEPSDARRYDEFRQRRFPRDQFLAGWCATHAQPVLLPRRAWTHPYFDGVPDALAGTRTRSLMCVPVRDEHEGVLAVIQVANKIGVRAPPPPPPPPPAPSAIHLSDGAAAAAAAADGSISLELRPRVPFPKGVAPPPVDSAVAADGSVASTSPSLSASGTPVIGPSGSVDSDSDSDSSDASVGVFDEFNLEDLDLLVHLSRSLCAPLKRFSAEIMLDQFTVGGYTAGEQLVGALGGLGSSTNIINPGSNGSASSTASSVIAAIPPPLHVRTATGDSVASGVSFGADRIGTPDRDRDREVSPRKLSSSETQRALEREKQVASEHAGEGGLATRRTDGGASNQVSPARDGLAHVESRPVSVPPSRSSGGPNTRGSGRDSPPLVPASLPTMSRLYSPLPGGGAAAVPLGASVGAHHTPSGLRGSIAIASMNTGGGYDAQGADAVRSLVHSYAVNETNLLSTRASARSVRARTLSFQWPSAGVSAAPSEKSSPMSHRASTSSLLSATPVQSPSHHLSYPTSVPMHPSQRVFSIEDLHSLQFNVFDYSEPELVRFTVGVFRSMGLIDEFRISMKVLQTFLVGVVKNYHANPFHNFMHGFSVMHFAYYTLRHSSAASHLLPHDVLALLVASLTHDLDHPGHTNSFEIASKSPLALLYNDSHVLEQHHASSTFKLLRHEKSNIFGGVSADVRGAMRTSMIKAILCTDMAEHFAELKKLDEACAKYSAAKATLMHQAQAAAQINNAAFTDGANVRVDALAASDRHASWPSLSSSAPIVSPLLQMPGMRGSVVDPMRGPNGGASMHFPSPPECPLPFDPEQEKDRQALVNIIIHSADLSGQVFPTHIARQWEERISREFQDQAIQETKLGLTVAPFMKGLDNPKTRAKLQVNFIEFVLLPWWRSVARLLSPALDHALRCLTLNKEHFERLAASLPDEPPVVAPPTTTSPTAGDMNGNHASTNTPQTHSRPPSHPSTPGHSASNSAGNIVATPIHSSHHAGNVVATPIHSPHHRHDSGGPTPMNLSRAYSTPSRTRTLANAGVLDTSAPVPRSASTTPLSASRMLPPMSAPSTPLLSSTSSVSTPSSLTSNPAEHSQLHQSSPIASPATRVATASAVLKSVPMLPHAASTAARNSGGGASSIHTLLHRMQVQGRKRSSTESSRGRHAPHAHDDEEVLEHFRAATAAAAARARHNSHDEHELDGEIGTHRDENEGE